MKHIFSKTAFYIFLFGLFQACSAVEIEPRSDVVETISAQTLSALSEQPVTNTPLPVPPKEDQAPIATFTSPFASALPTPISCTSH